MPYYDVHIALFLGLAFVIAGVVYLYLSDGKSERGPLRVAGFIFLISVVVTSLVYVAYYEIKYGRFSQKSHTSGQVTESMQGLHGKTGNDQ